ncbi:MAG TPA: hypothetical protein VIS07_07505 [Candidatus Binatia bacterium]
MVQRGVAAALAAVLLTTAWDVAAAAHDHDHHRAASIPAPVPSPPTHEQVHDHEPRHGGVVGMSGDRHIEAVARRDGVLRFYLTDFGRAPLPLDGVRGTATVRTEDGGTKETLELVPRDGALEARGAPLAGDMVDVRMEASLGDEQLLIDFTLPVSPTGSTGATGAAH